jgi:hypothetical protein
MDFPSLCLTLAFTISMVALTYHRVTGSASPQVFKIFHSTHSTANANVAGHDGSAGTTPHGAASAARSAAPWGFSAADARKVVAPMHMGIMQSRYQGSFSSAPSRRFVRLML